MSKLFRALAAVCCNWIKEAVLPAALIFPSFNAAEQTLEASLAEPQDEAFDRGFIQFIVGAHIQRSRSVQKKEQHPLQETCC